MCEIHQISYIVIGSDHLNLGNRLLDMHVGAGFWEIFGIGDVEVGVYLTIRKVSTTSLSLDIILIIDRDKSPDLTRILHEFWVGSRIIRSLIPMDEHLIGNLWTRDDDVHIMLSPETLLHDIEMQESEKSTTKSIPKCR